MPEELSNIDLNPNIESEKDIENTQKHPTLYHQASPEVLEAIIKDGFKLTTSEGRINFVKGIFLKDTPDLLKTRSGDTRGDVQIPVEIKPNTKILDLTGEESASFSGIKDKGSQERALVGWLERNGHENLARRYRDALGYLIPKSSNATSDATYLDKVWPEVQKTLEGLGYGGIKFIDHFILIKKDSDRTLTQRLFLNQRI